MTSIISGIYDEIEIEDMDFDEEEGIFYYPCPCGDKFQISIDQIKDKQDIAECPSCSLTIKIIFDDGDWEEYEKLMEEAKQDGE